jgi:hypothetical protein
VSAELESLPQIDYPVKLLPDLSEWGIIDATDLGICPNSAENRRIIREHKARFQDVYNTEGKPTGLIQVITPQMIEANRTSNRRPLLSDPDDVDSDFISGMGLLMDSVARDMAPSWVTAATRHWMTVEDERERRGANGKLYRPALESAPGRCRAHTLAGNRCWNWHNGMASMAGLCKMHVGSHHNDPELEANYLAKARNRLISASILAVDVLEDMAANATSEPARVAASNSILDRAGIRGGVEVEQKVEIQVVPASKVVSERLAKLAEGAREREKLEAARYALESKDAEEEVVDAEVVEDD